MTSPVIDARWSARAHRSPQLILPDGCVDVIARRGELWVVGPMTRARSVTISAQPPRGIRFRPARVRPWLGISPEELADGVVQAREIRALRQLHTLDEVAALARSTAAPSGAVQRAVAALRDEPTAPIGAIAKLAGVSARQLRRAFNVEVGLSPKRFARVQRLQRLTELMRAPEAGSLVDLAYAAGYADQAHMSREVSALATTSPRALRRLVAARLA